MNPSSSSPAPDIPRTLPRARAARPTNFYFPNGYSRLPQPLDTTARYNERSPVKIRLRDRDEVAPFFDGLEFVDRGLVPLSQWWSTGPVDTDTVSGLVGHVGIARKP
jgi:S-adenosyl methyltransferase